VSVAPAILLVESDRALAESLATQLIADGYRVELARTADHARLLAGECRPRLAVLGALDHDRGGVGLLEEIRDAGEKWDPQLPALVIGASAQQLDMLRAFEAGADDFMSQPLSYLELRARIRALLRRSEQTARDADLAIEVGSLRVDSVRRAAWLENRQIELRRMEYELLLHLAREPDRVFSRQELLQAIWGYRSHGSTRTIDTHASRLRHKLQAVAPGPWLVSVWGVGYRLM